MENWWKNYNKLVSNLQKKKNLINLYKPKEKETKLLTMILMRRAMIQNGIPVCHQLLTSGAGLDWCNLLYN